MGKPESTRASRTGAASAPLERETELKRFRAMIEGARGGTASAAVIEGPAGIGKSRILEWGRERCVQAGVTALFARGGELERDYSFGVARQIFEPVLANAEASEREELLAGPARRATMAVGVDPGGDEAPDAAFAAIHGLYWLCVNLCERGPLGILVDDLHWADEASQRFLAYLARRMEDLPLLLAIATRPAEPGPDTSLAGALAADSRAEIMRPAPLSQEATTEVVREVMGTVPEGEFAAACHEVTAGNPLLITELLRSLAADGVTPTAENAAAVRGADAVTIARGVLARIARLGPEATEVARLVAVLGTRVPVRDVAALAGLDVARASRAADALAAAGVFEAGRPLDFTHPLVRTAVHSDMPVGALADAHRRAAEVVWDHGGGADGVAAHLLATEPAGDPWTVDRLREAAGQALAEGAPVAAGRYLERALEEPPAEADEPVLATELGRALIRAGDPRALERLGAAIATGGEAATRGMAALEMSRVMVMADMVDEAVATLDSILPEVETTDPELGRQIEAELIVAALTSRKSLELGRQHIARMIGDLDLDRRPDLLVQAVTTLGGIATMGLDAATGARLASELLDREALYEDAMTIGLVYATSALALADRPADAMRAIDRGLGLASERGSMVSFALLSTYRAYAAFRYGDMAHAETDSRAAARVLEAGGWGAISGVPAILAHALVEVDKVDEAAEVLASAGLWEEIPDLRHANFALRSRAAVRSARGELDEALADHLEFGRRTIDWQTPNPALGPWRTEAARILVVRGEREEALRLASEELELARAFGGEATIGTALAGLGAVTPGAEGIALLRDAVAGLREADAPFERARAEFFLGAALRREGSRVEAREHLGQALHVADTLGAKRLAGRARAELITAGAKPRRERTSGPEALTASERRVAELAADGLTNREIAQQLFVSLRTVETHLTSTYRKLDISSRKQLSAALRPPSAP